MISGGLVCHYFPTTISYLSLLGTYIAANTKECTNFRANWFVEFGNKFLTSSITFAFEANVINAFKCNLCVQVSSSEDRFIFAHWAVLDSISSKTCSLQDLKGNQRHWIISLWRFLACFKETLWCIGLFL